MLRSFFAVALCAASVLLSGCGGFAYRDSIPESERVKVYTIAHTKGRAAAFDAIELQLAESFNDLSRVMQAKQPQSGTFVLRPVVTTMVGLPGAYQSIYYPYGARIVVEDAKITLTCSLSANEQHGQYPAADSMPEVYAWWETLAVSVSNSVGGTIDPACLMPPEEKKAPAAAPRSTKTK